MPYAQINYPQNLGTGPSVATIAAVGCFLTGFCNLLERYGEAVDPPTLNNYFIAHGSYAAEGSNRDLLGWGSISAFDGSIVANQIGGAGWPPNNDAIVKFVYKSRNGAEITHFCLVADHSNGIIIDSYDGHTKHTPYGNPVGWATYIKHAPEVVTPPPPAEVEPYTVEVISKKAVQLTKNTNLWDITQRSWPGMVNNPVSSANSGFVFNCSRVAHHVLGGVYYMPDSDDHHGYNIVDCQDYVAPPPVESVRPMGNPDNKYEVIKTIPGYGNATHAGNHINQTNEVAAGEYYVFNTYPGNDQLVNVTSKLGSPGSWINKADNVPDAPPPPPAPEPAPEPEPTPAPPPEPPAPEPVVAAPVVDPADWRTTFQPFEKPMHFIATRDLSVWDLSGQQPDMPLQRYDPGSGSKAGMVSAFGTVTKEGIEYYRLKTNTDPEFKYWYAVPKLDANTGTPNLLAVPLTGKPIGKATAVHDTLHLAKSRLETDASKFLDDILPGFLRKKQK